MGEWIAGPRRRALRQFLALAAASVIVPALLFAFLAWDSRGDVIKDTEQRARKTVDVLHEHALRVFSTHRLALDNVDQQLAGLSWEEVFRSEKLHLALRQIPERLAEVAALWAADANGIIRNGTRFFPALPPIDISDRDYFQAQRTGGAGLFISPPYEAKAGGGFQFNVSRRRSTADGRFDGIVALSVAPAYFNAFYRSIITNPLDAVSLIHADGIFLARVPTPEDFQSGIKLSSESPFLRAIIEAPEAGTYNAPSVVDGTTRIAAYRKLAGFPVYVFYAYDLDSALANWRARVWQYAAICAAASGALLFVAFLVYRHTRSEEAALARWREEAARREAAEGELRQAQKMEAVGQLTSGIAHDFNNLLAAIIGNLELLRGRVEGERVLKLINSASHAADRGARLTEQLLAFARRQHLDPKPIDLGTRIAAMEELVQRTIGPSVQVVRRTGGELWPALADPSQVEVVLLNLVINARDAMPLGGTLTIETANIPAGHERLPGGLAGDFVLLAVSDTGTGMGEEVRARAFEPFFTTKPRGKGSGLGLSMVYGFARQSGGTATIASAPGRGTSVSLFLPRAAAVERPAPPDRTIPVERRLGKILVVDDDREVRAFTAGSLRELKHEVLEAEGGWSALEVMAAHDDIDLLVVDFAMPSMNGAELGQRARARRPGLPILLVTGYTEAEIAELPPGTEILKKPFRMAELDERVGRALAGAAKVLPLRPTGRQEGRRG